MLIEAPRRNRPSAAHAFILQDCPRPPCKSRRSPSGRRRRWPPWSRICQSTHPRSRARRNDGERRVVVGDRKRTADDGVRIGTARIVAALQMFDDDGALLGGQRARFTISRQGALQPWKPIPDGAEIADLRPYRIGGRRRSRALICISWRRLPQTAMGQAKSRNAPATGAARVDAIAWGVGWASGRTGRSPSTRRNERRRDGSPARASAARSFRCERPPCSA